MNDPRNVEIIKKDDDPINPQHYAHLNRIGMSALQVCETWGLGFHLGNTLKYIQRAGLKPGASEVEDLKKAAWYLNRHIHNLDPTHPDPMKK